MSNVINSLSNNFKSILEAFSISFSYKNTYVFELETKILV
jgi:hypothetical protein